MAQKMKRRRVNTNQTVVPKTVQQAASTIEISSVNQTTEDLRKWYNENKDLLENFSKTNKNNINKSEGLKILRDVTKSGTKLVTAFSKDSLRTYLKNISNNEKNLRNLSRYLFYRCHPYYRLIMYQANMFCLDARSVVPVFDIIKGADPTKILKSFQETTVMLDKMNLQYEMLKAYVTCFREDVFYGCAFYDDIGLFIMPLDPDFCKISGVYSSGDFSFSMDMTYWKSRLKILEYIGEPFQSMYKAYENDPTNGRWQPMPDEYAACFKARAEDWETIVPVFSGLLSGIINLIDLDDIQAISDRQDIYKMLWIELETIAGSKEIDDWRVNPDILVEYFNKMVNEAIDDYTTAAIIPGKIEQVSFNNDKASDTNKIAKSTETLFNSSGGAQVLNGLTISGSTAWGGAIQADTEMAISMLLPQTQAWVNRFLSYHISNPCKVKFFEISSYTRSEFKKQLLESCQYGLPNILAYNSLNGMSAIDTLSLNFLEQDILHLTDKLIPLQSSYTQSGKKSDDSKGEEGAPVKDDDEISSEGEASRDKADKAKG